MSSAAVLVFVAPTASTPLGRPCRPALIALVSVSVAGAVAVARSVGDRLQHGFGDGQQLRRQLSLVDPLLGVVEQLSGLVGLFASVLLLDLL